jgi:plastocyanin
MRFRRALVVLLPLLLIGAAAACGSSKPKAVPPPAPVDARGQKQVSISANQNQFTPAAIIVDVGTKITWTNTDSVAHDVKKSADALDFGAPFGADASKFGPGQSYSFTFTKAGTFTYTCTIHTLMDGKVDVVAKP